MTDRISHIAAPDSSLDEALAPLLPSLQREALPEALATYEGDYFSWTLYDDGSARIAGHEVACPWTIERGTLVIRNIGPGAPKQGWIDRFTINFDGKSAMAKNQHNGNYKATFLTADRPN